MSREFHVAPPGNDPTLGFEFDVQYGLIKDIIENAGFVMPNDGDRITDHNDATDGFQVERDGFGPAIAQFEIKTKKFRAVASGRADLDQVIANILKFARRT